MMREDYTDITVIVDRSGSMQSVKTDMEGGLQSFIDDQKKLPGKCLLTLNQFDGEFENIYTAQDIGDCPRYELVPRGATSLLDAIGRSVNATGERLRDIREEERPSKVICIIITDGEENSSQEFQRDDILKLVKSQEDDYKWQFVFLGADQNAIQAGGSMGVKGGSAMAYSSSKDGVKSMFGSLNDKMGAVRGMSAAQYSDVQCSGKLFDEDDVKKQKDAGLDEKWGK